MPENIIKFSKNLSLDETIELFENIVNILPLNIYYSVQKRNEIKLYKEANNKNLFHIGLSSLTVVGRIRYREDIINNIKTCCVFKLYGSIDKEIPIKDIPNFPYFKELELLSKISTDKLQSIKHCIEDYFISKR